MGMSKKEALPSAWDWGSLTAPEERGLPRTESVDSAMSPGY